VQNHLVTKDLAAQASASRAAGAAPKKSLLVWAGDENIAGTLVKDGTLAGRLNKIKNALPGPDFLAVIDPGTPAAGPHWGAYDNAPAGRQVAYPTQIPRLAR
jgi:hypothetical protein